MRFSASTLGWYPEAIGYPSLPDDVIEVSDQLYLQLRDCQIEAGPDGMPRAFQPAPPTAQHVQATLTAAIQQVMDAQAQQRGYDDLKTAITYRGDPNPKFAAEAEAFFLWRSAVWTQAYEHLALVDAGHAEMPTMEQALGMMPALELA